MGVSVGATKNIATHSFSDEGRRVELLKNNLYYMNMFGSLGVKGKAY